MTEAIQVMRLCWTAEPAEFHGAYYDLQPFSMNPKPIQPGGISVICGGHEDSALRRVAQIADGWQPYRLVPERLAERMERLKTFLDDVGREMSELSLIVRISDRDTLTEAMVRDYRTLGVDVLIHDLDYAHLDSAQALYSLKQRAEQIGA